MTIFETALVLHLVADWLLQNEWMAVNKVHLSHPAAWVHSGIHALLLAFPLGWKAGLVLGLVHMLVDTRIPLRWWFRVYKKSEGSPDASLLLIGCDQVVHIVCIATWIFLASQR